MWQESGFWKRPSNLTAEKIHEEPADERNVVPAPKDERPSRQAIANPLVLRMAAHARRIEQSTVGF